MSFGWSLFDATVCFYISGIILLLLVRKLGFDGGEFWFVVLGYAAIAVTDAFIRQIRIHPAICFFILLTETILYSIFVFKGSLARRFLWGFLSCGLSQLIAFLTITVYIAAAKQDISSFIHPSQTRFIIFVYYLLVLTIFYFVIGSIGGKKPYSPPFRVVLIYVFAGVLLASLQMANLYTVYGTGNAAARDISEKLVVLTAVLMASLLAILFFFEYTDWLAQKKKQAELELEQKNREGEYLKQISQTYQTLRDWKHDYQNHMDVLRSLLKNKQYREMDEYLSQMDGGIGPSMQIYYTGNSVVDAVLSNKLFLAKTRGIQVNAVTVLPAKLSISDVQFGSVLGNLLDNALEAQGAVNEPFINVSIRRERGMLQIRVENSASGMYSYKGSRLVSSKGEGHGIGLANIRKIVEIAGGIMDILPEPDRFTVKILLPLKMESEVS